MDARPQRMTRAQFRVQNDENAVPDGPLLRKTIHQRNKSSPALTTINPSKGVTKRSAFGDISNVSNLKRVSKDDSSVASKIASQLPIKAGLQERKSTNFLRPPQRPSVSSIRTLLGGGNSSTDSTATKIALNDSTNISQSIAAVPSKRGLTKRGTTIFKDASLPVVQEHEVQSEDTSPEILDDLPAPMLPVLAPIDVTNLDPLTRLLPPSKVENAESEKQIQPSDFSLPGIDTVKLESSHFSSESDIKQAVTQPTEIKIEPVSEPAQTTATQPLDDTAGQTQYVDALVDLPAVADAVPASAAYQQEAQPMSADWVPESLRHIYEPTPEPEEYWDEEYEEAYDGEGYVTARSFKSGDDTTGGATTALVPKFNQRVMKEIEAAQAYVEATRSEEEIEDESFDTSMVAEYGDEIFGYMRELEQRMLPRSNYMDSQHEIQWSMRAVLMDWLVQVHHRFNLLPETLFLCVNYIDRFLSVKVVSLGKLQLVGATAIFIAAKYEEINCPSVQEIVYMVDGGYAVDEILKAERFMLTMLQFELGFPGPMSFLRRISKADDYDLETRTLAKYFLEVTLMDERFIGSVPSFLAAASHCLAREMLRKGTWSLHHVHYSGYTWSQLRPAVQLLLDCCEHPRKHHQAVFNKYCDKRYKRAAAFVETEIQRGFVLRDSLPLKNAYHHDYQQAFQFAAGTCYA